ncbi:MAG TPA: hypothetical protein VFY92_10740 [Hyphomicrobiaceae bacterium]|nr:hypothetical protein [Hyphomicrobiaceae bacterium]
MTSLLRRVGMPLLYIGLGVLLTVAAIAAWLYYASQAGPSAEELKRRYMLEYAKSEQERRGVNCHRLGEEIAAFLAGPLPEALKARAPGQSWKPLVTEDHVAKVQRLSDWNMTCMLIYKAAQDARLDGFDSLSYAPEIEKDLSMVRILLKIGPATKNCDASCVDSMFKELIDAQQAVVKRLRRAR